MHHLTYKLKLHFIKMIELFTSRWLKSHPFRSTGMGRCRWYVSEKRCSIFFLVLQKKKIIVQICHPLNLYLDMGLNTPQYPCIHFSSKIIHTSYIYCFTVFKHVFLESPASVTTITSKVENKKLQKTMMDKVYPHRIMLLFSTPNLIFISSKYRIYTWFLVVWTNNRHIFTRTKDLST